MSAPSGFRAVVERRASKEVEADTPERRRWRELDFFATPPWASRAGAEIIARLDPCASTISEPACGDGIMAACLSEYFLDVIASDICPQGSIGETKDFLLGETADCDWVFTNPPFALLIPFIEMALQKASRGAAMLCRLSAMEGAKRYTVLHGGAHPLTVLAPFSERVAMQLGPWNPKCSTATAYAWFIFMKGESPQPIHPIPPGTCARLSRADDIRRFCKQTAGRLL